MYLCYSGCILFYFFVSVPLSTQENQQNICTMTHSRIFSDVEVIALQRFGQLEIGMSLETLMLSII